MRKAIVEELPGSILKKRRLRRKECFTDLTEDSRLSEPAHT